MHRTLLLSCLTSRQANRHVLLLVTDGIAVVCLARAVQKPATYQQRMPETPALTANNAKGSALPSQLLQEAVLALHNFQLWVASLGSTVKAGASSYAWISI